MTPLEWQILHASQGQQLARAAAQAHHAAQLVSAPGTSLLAPRADFDHTTLVFEPSRGILAGHPVDGVRAALDPVALELLVLQGDRERSRRSLDGDTPAAALAWLAAAFAGQQARAVDLSPPVHDLPPFPGPAFTVEPAGGEELRRLFANFWSLSLPLQRDSAATPLRVWPHHFDMALRLVIEGERGVGMGLSPGDAGHPGPYLYVTPWPYPDGDLPELPEGRWNREGWTGALLPLHEGPPGAAEQEARARRFLDAAVLACRRLLA